MSIFFLIVYYIANIGLNILMICFFVRAFLSWFQIDERYAIVRFLAYVTDPFIEPFRRFVKPIGFFDLSFFLAAFSIQIIRILILQALPI
ncbi:YggT family protein [Thermosporothrix hazakensis]|jgi:YggT family protein|uniref:YggT family protein n=2 Tax=Thermosporothrix TaxID=768650 RepID=A0A326USI7_THEHA|nr:YggT family protein [Thermosporothrix hazakensis]PZW36829.1 YggT family protein [Thermosporothrix hazakensis]BBH89295.1 hypothetical protein KTC_40460 [Thermosporothrix sp. COM3]GCE47478.1 hypothetical protein KTH_23470 [Thermosporothrix hazakensis]